MLSKTQIIVLPQSLCTERLVMHTNYSFPGILQWYEVIRTEQLTLSPVCTANEAVKFACKELQKEIDKTKKDSSIDAIKSLSMKLQGMISASVQGGIPKYQEVGIFYQNNKNYFVYEVYLI